MTRINPLGRARKSDLGVLIGAAAAAGGSAVRSVCAPAAAQWPRLFSSSANSIRTRSARTSTSIRGVDRNIGAVGLVGSTHQTQGAIRACNAGQDCAEEHYGPTRILFAGLLRLQARLQP